jgi:hypothetical protein
MTLLELIDYLARKKVKRCQVSLVIFSMLWINVLLGAGIRNQIVQEQGPVLHVAKIYYKKVSDLFLHLLHSLGSHATAKEDHKRCTVRGLDWRLPLMGRGKAGLL